MNAEGKKYTVIRSARKTLSLRIGRDGEVVVRAPRAASNETIEAFVARYAGWIAARRETLAHTRPDFSDGAPLVLYGKGYVIRSGRARMKDGSVYLPAEGRERALAALLKKLARVQMTAFAEEYAARFEFRYRGVRITSARSRWGSCNAEGALAFSFRTAFLSEEQARYVVVHELCHTRRLDHSPAFWKEVAAVLPGYAAVRKSLKTISYVMNWL